MKRDIRFLVMDVDGTLTDGKIYMGQNGEMCKAFSIKDGCGLLFLIQPANIRPVIITSRTSRILENRCRELGITELYQGILEKKAKLDEVLQKYSRADGETYDEKNVAYIGDDINDLSAMQPIKAGGGLLGCPANAVQAVREIVHYTAPHDGGDGAVRDFIEWLTERD